MLAQGFIICMQESLHFCEEWMRRMYLCFYRRLRSILDN
uniref:Uncharacterized protein n=1 Tax=Anguilla anguilla TaxID=7936 RepID=A0A0E9R5W3_ANGAN